MVRSLQIVLLKLVVLNMTNKNNGFLESKMRRWGLNKDRVKNLK